MPDDLRRILAVLPELARGGTLELGIAAERLRSEEMLKKKASSTKLFGKYPQWFALTPEGQPNKVQFLGVHGRLTAAEDARAALATVARGATFFAPYAASARLVEAQGPPGGAWLDALNGALAQRPPVVLDTCADPLRFVPAGELPAGEAYEAFIARTARVPTRGNLHDLFNALVWLTFPEMKRQLNALQAAQIAQHGVAAHRGAARDALTLFDENGAMWSAPPTLAHALGQRDWPALFITQRAVWRGAEPLLFGHALLEKLLQPRKAITAHLWPITPSDDAQRVIDEPHLPLPVLGVPGWWPANESPGFYDDAAVFRPVSIISR